MAYRDTIQAETGLLFYWPMDEASGTALAALVGGVNLTLGTSTAKPTLGVTGQVDGTAVQFDGVNDFAKSAAAIDLSGHSKIVVEFLLLWDAYSNNDNLALELTANAGVNAGGFFFDVNEFSGTPRFFVKGDVGNNSVTFARPTAAAWHHYAFVLDQAAVAATEVIPYVDGAPIGYTKPNSANNAGTFANAVLNVMCRNGASLFGAGRMQHLAIYSDLSAARIAAHYTAATADTTPPTVTANAINTAGTTLTLTTSETVTAGAGGTAGITMSMSGGAVTATYASGTGSTSLVYSLSRTIGVGETGTFTYTQPGNGWEDAAGNDLATISAASVTNNSTADITAPTLASPTIPSAGTTLTATLSESGCTPASGTGGFTLGGTSATVVSWAISGTTLTLALAGAVLSGETVTCSYDRATTTDDIADAAGNFLANFTAASVTNNSTAVAATDSASTAGVLLATGII